MIEKVDSKQIGHVYNDLANKYGAKKKQSMINILYCGQILNNAKKILPHGMFSNFLADTRVAESERTAQRLMAIFRNFGHLLSQPDSKISVLDKLGVSHLLELQKLPKRFRKEVEIESEYQGEVIKENVEVIDEEKLTDFLDKNVDYKGEKKHIRDLPLNEMKQHINQASGIFEPTKNESDQQMYDDTENKEAYTNSELPSMKGAEETGEVEINTLDSEGGVASSITDETHIKKLRSELSEFTINCNKIVGVTDGFLERDDLDNIPSDIKQNILKESGIVKSKIESILMKLIELEDELR